MHQTTANPTTDPALAGRKQRHALGTVAWRHVRLDLQSDLTLANLKEALTGPTPDDVATVSLVVRRALAVYWQRVGQRLTDAHALEAERLAVRQHSRMPKRSKRKDGGAICVNP